MKSDTPTRREFCTQACGVVGLAALGSALQACGAAGPGSPNSVPALPTVTAAPGNGVVTLTVDSTSPLAAVGSAALVRGSNAVFLVAHTGQDTFSALTSICTHQACTITGFDSETFVCPCHGSRFDLGGRVLNGPAVTGLRAFPTRFSGDVLTITL